MVRDANNQALAYVYSRATEAEALQAKVLTENEASTSSATPSLGAGADGKH